MQANFSLRVVNKALLDMYANQYGDDIDVELIAKQRVIFQVQKIENSVVSYKEFIKPSAVKQMFIYHLRAICSPKGIKFLNEKMNESEQN